MKTLYESILSKDYDGADLSELDMILKMYPWKCYFQTGEMKWITLKPGEGNINPIEIFFTSKRLKKVSPDKFNGGILLCVTDGINAQHLPTRYVGLLRVENIDGHLLTGEQIVIGYTEKTRTLFMHRDLPVQWATGLTVIDSMLTLDWYDKGNRQFYAFRNADDGVKYMKQLRDVIMAAKK